MSLKVIANLRSHEAKTAVMSALEGFNGTQVEMREGKLSELLGGMVSETGSPTLILVDVDADDPADVKALEDLVRGLPAGLAVVATSKQATVDSVRKLMRIGIADFVPQPIAQADLFGALEIAAKKCIAAAGPSRKTGQVLTFIKASGGMGATTLATQLAYSLAVGNKRAAKKKVCLMDLDIQCGDIATYLDLESKFSVLDLAGSPDRLDSSLLEHVLVGHDSGLQVLAAPREMMPLDSVSPEIAAKLVEVCATSFDYVIADLPHDWTAWSTAILAETDCIVLVMELSVAGIRHARRRLDLLKRENTNSTPIIVVANRFEKPGMFADSVRVKEAEKALDHAIDHFVASDYRTVSSALNQGLPLAKVRRGARVVKDINKFVATVRKNGGTDKGRTEPTFVGK